MTDKPKTDELAAACRDAAEAMRHQTEVLRNHGQATDPVAIWEPAERLVDRITDAADALDRLAAVEAERDRLRAALADWTDGEPPKDGREYEVRPVPAIFRWVRYKSGAPKNLLKKGGRWQTSNGYGGYENAELPGHLYRVPAYRAEAAKAADEIRAALSETGGA